jgi:hypothetical protein
MTYVAKVGELVPLRTSCYIRNTLLSYSKNSVVGTYRMNIGILHFRWTWSLVPNQRSAVCIQHTSSDLHSAAPNCWALFEITLLQTSWNGLLMDQPASRMKIIPQLILVRAVGGDSSSTTESIRPESGTQTQPAATRNPSFCLRSFQGDVRYSTACKMNPISSVRAA